MRPTKKLMISAAGGILLVPLWAWLGFEFWGIALYNLGLICAIAYDMILTKNHLRYTLIRKDVPKLHRAVKSTLGFTLENTGVFEMDFMGIEALTPFVFEGDFSGFKGRLKPGEVGDYTYHITPLKRGDYTLKTLKVSTVSALKFLQVDRKFDLPTPVQVYPNLEALHDFAWQRLQNRRYLEAMKKLRLKSTGHDFESLRDYRAGDDYRSLNWLATARTGHPVVNQYQMENNQRVYIMIDCGRSMSYTLRGHRQMDVAIETTVVLAHRVQESGDQFAFAAFDQKLRHYLPCAKGLSQRQKLVECAYNLEPSMNSAHYGDAFLGTMHKERHRSIVMLFTDFDTEKDVDRFLAQIAYGLKRHVFVVLLMERSDLSTVATGDFREEGVYEQGTALKLLEEREAIIARLKRYGVFAVVCPPEQLAAEAIQQYLFAKAKLQGL